MSGETCRFTFFSRTKPNESKMNKAQSRILSFFASSETRKENHWWSCNESQSHHSLRISLSAAIRTCLKHCCWQNSWYFPTDSDCSDESVWGGGGAHTETYASVYSIVSSPVSTTLCESVWGVLSKHSTQLALLCCAGGDHRQMVSHYVLNPCQPMGALFMGTFTQIFFVS